MVLTRRTVTKKLTSFKIAAGISVHEMSIAQNLIDVLKEEMTKHQVKTLRSVRLNIGQMSAIVPDALSFCFQVITDGTELEGVKLLMDIVPLMGYCHACDKEFEIKDYTFLCPTCGGTKIDTIGGQGMSVVEMDAE